ncbi:hypothetical protein MTR67_046015 [Solanum verrucosum]|uniref:DUF6821 domain-containing protein n=1 Tax=Solanum verrucosum TaxID=315347 RepID=A0AAF0UTS4_SOLVR|nr:uncharacterized protein LOC125806857 [Solanum verrucosum]WMV52630.1 hypothetical protein MTR67_046015 [Solanum verrucosum]
MDLQEWELLSDNGLLEVLHDDRNKFLSMEYASDSKRVPNQLVIPLLIQQEPSIQKPQEDEEVIKEVITKVPLEDEEDKKSQVFFKKMKESEFENMKLDSPKFNNKTSSVSQIDSMSFPFEDKVEVLEVEKDSLIKKREINEENNNGGINLWNWRLTGIGAICSFGVAAAAVTIYIFIGNHQKQKQHKQNQKLKFQFSDDKKMKQVVQQPATKLNEAIRGVRGSVPITKKHITDVEGLLLRSLEHIQDCLSVS